MLVAFQKIFYDCQGHFFVCILDEPKIYVFFFPAGYLIPMPLSLSLFDDNSNCNQK